MSNFSGSYQYGSPFFLLFKLYRQHREVIALFGSAYKGVDRICHVPDNLHGLQLSVGYQRLGNVLDAFIAKLGVIDILSFVQSIGEEEDGRRSLKSGLLLLELEISDDADRQITLTRQYCNLAA